VELLNNGTVLNNELSFPIGETWLGLHRHCWPCNEAEDSRISALYVVCWLRSENALFSRWNMHYICGMPLVWYLPVLSSDTFCRKESQSHSTGKSFVRTVNVLFVCSSISVLYAHCILPTTLIKLENYILPKLKQRADSLIVHCQTAQMRTISVSNKGIQNHAFWYFSRVQRIKGSSVPFNG
jgi:hypothetical protein